MISMPVRPTKAAPAEDEDEARIPCSKDVQEPLDPCRGQRALATGQTEADNRSGYKGSDGLREACHVIGPLLS